MIIIVFDKAYLSIRFRESKIKTSIHMTICHKIIKTSIFAYLLME